MTKRRAKSLSDKEPVLTYSSMRKLFLEAYAKGWEPSTFSQKRLLLDTMLEDKDDTQDEAIWMCRDIMEASAADLFRILYRGDDAETRFTKASLRKFWEDTNYMLQDLIGDKERK